MESFTQRGGWWVAAQVGLFAAYGLALLAAGPELGPGWPRRLLAAAGVASLSGAVLLGLGGLRALGRGLTPYPEPLPGAALVDHGAYRIVRHPLYGAVVLAAAGVALLRAALGPALAAGALTAFFAWKSTREERRLAATYAGYDAYRKRVPHRLVPGVW